MQRANFVTSVVDRGLGTGTTYTFDALAALAGNPDTLIDELSLRLTHGTLPPEAKTVIRNFVTGTTNATFRVNRALYLVATSPYAVVSGERMAAPGRRSGGRQGATRREQ
jgi:hypothetical protein